MHIMRYFFNSFKVAGISVVLSIIMISMSAYVVARMNFKFKSVVSVMLMSTLFIPPTAMTFPVYNLINSMGINDTHAGLILIYTCSGIAVSFMVIKNYFLTIPVELEEAARIDGASWIQVFFSVILPLSVPVAITAGLMIFVNEWNNFFWPLLATRTEAARTIQVALSYFSDENQVYFSYIFAGSAISAVVPVLLFLPLQKYFVQGITSSGVKG